MSSAALDRVLAILVVGQLATGLVSLRAGTPSSAPLFWLHGLLGGALLVAAAWKVRRSLPGARRARRYGRLAIGLLVALLAAAALGGGLAWVASGRLLSIGPWTVLTLHVWAALALIPILAAHLLPHRWRLLRWRRTAVAGPLMSRRTALRVVALAGLGAGVWAATNVLDAVQGGVRRFTGSRWLPDGGVPPPTTFYGEGAPAIDADDWRLAVRSGNAAPLALDLVALRALGDVEREAVLDCTSGWAMRTRWRGTPLRAVLTAAGASDPSRVTVRSATGWLVRLESWELDDALLATHVAGEPLPTLNGAPCRLVAPTRRGLDWIKWVTEVEVA